MPQSSTVPCPERDRLVAAFFGAVKDYSDAVGKLGGRIGSDSKYGWERADRARAQCEQLRRELQRHDVDHNCFIEPETKTLPLND